MAAALSWLALAAAPAPPTATMHLRPPVSPFGNVEQFPPVEARYVRFIILETNGSAPCLDELEVYTDESDPRNVALRDAGAIPSASASQVVPNIHQLRNLNDGRYGNEASWLAGEDGAGGVQAVTGENHAGSTDWWVQIELAQVTRINKVVWSRDRTGTHVTRTPTRYRIEVATQPGDWQVVASSDDREAFPELIPLPRPPASPTTLSCLTQSWGETDGLPSNAVNNLARTPDGYLWVSTDAGLARFDGDHFTVFDGTSVPELRGTAFGELYCDWKGRLWIELKLPSGAGDNFACYESGRFHRLNLGGRRARFIRTDREGTPWVALGPGIFPLLNGRLATNSPLPSPPTDIRLAAVVAANHNLWVFSQPHFGKLSRAGWDVVTAADGQPVRFNSARIRSAPCRDGGAWLATGGLDETGMVDRGPNLLQRLRPGGELTEPRPFPWQKRSFRLEELSEDGVGCLWVAAGPPDNALYRLWPDGERAERYTASEGLSDISISRLYVDQEGDVWVATRRGGVNLLRPKIFQTPVALPDGPLPDVVSVAPARSEGVWLCAHLYGLYRWNDRQLERLFTDEAPMWSVLEDRDGGIWSGAPAFCGVRYHNRNWTRVLPLTTDSDGTVALLEDRQGRIWVGGSFGLACYDHGQSQLYPTDRFASRPGDRVIALAEAPDRTLWFGTLGGSLHRLQDGAFQTIWRPQASPSFPVCSLYFDHSGTLWFARFGAGLSRLEDGRLEHFGTTDGLPAATINGMIEDDQGFVWLTSKSGVYRIDQAGFRAFARRENSQAHWRHFTRNDGLPSLECHGEYNQPSLCRTPDGRIWIPTLNGLAVVNPAAVSAVPTPKVLIETVQLFGQGNRVQTLLADGEYLQQIGADPPRITVPPGPNSLVIHYAGIEFQDPAAVTFRHRLIGLDRAWVDIRRARTASYSGLTPGDYRFELVALGKAGVSSPPAFLNVRVLPFWWETWTFRCLVGILLLLSGPTYYAYRVNHLKRERAKQADFTRRLIAREEEERKRIAHEIHDVLGHDLLLLKNSAVQGAQDPAAVATSREQFDLISGLAARTLEESRGITYRLRPVELERLGFQHALEAMIAKVAATAGLQVFKEVDDLTGVLSAELQLYVYRLVQEGLNNVLKHAHASTVMLEIKRDGDRVTVRLEDNGVGFDATTVGAARGGGLGLAGMEERVKLIGGTFELASRPGRGTRIRAGIPLSPRA